MASDSRTRYLVTGAAGFIGANLCRSLLARGEQVDAFVKPDSNLWRLDGVAEQLRLHEIDLTDKTGVRGLVDRIRPDVIFHLATHGAYNFQDDAERIILTNVFGLWNLLEACEGNGYRLFVNTGSSSEYGFKSHAMRETDLLEPNSYYAVAKTGQTLLGQYFSRRHKRPIVTFRPFSVYGPWEDPTRLIPNLILAALDDKSIEMVSPETCRDFVYVDDVVDAYLSLDPDSVRGQEVFNLGTGVQTSLRDLVATFERVIGRSLDARWGALEGRIWDTDVWVADVSKARRILGWKPGTPLAEGLARTVDWLREHAEPYRAANTRC